MLNARRQAHLALMRKMATVVLNSCRILCSTLTGREGDCAAVRRGEASGPRPTASWGFASATKYKTFVARSPPPQHATRPRRPIIITT